MLEQQDIPQQIVTENTITMKRRITMKTIDSEVLAGYNSGREKGRLHRGLGLIEFERTKEILLEDKQKIRASKLKESVKEEILLVIDMLANVIESEDKDAVIYAFISYKYVAKSKKFIFMGRIKKVQKLLQDVLNAI